MIDTTRDRETVIESDDILRLHTQTKEASFFRGNKVLDFKVDGAFKNKVGLEFIETRRDFEDLCRFLAAIHGLRVLEITDSGNSWCCKFQ